MKNFQVPLDLYVAYSLTHIRTHNTDLKKRLAAYAGQHPDQCRQTDTDPDTGCMEFDIAKGRFSFRLTAPYSEERRKAARQYARDSNAADRLKQQVEIFTVLWYTLSVVRATNANLMRKIIYIIYRLWSENDHLSRISGNRFSIFLYCNRNRDEQNASCTKL